MKSDFRTQKGYERTEERELSAAMEDYLEMMTRLSMSGEPVRINALSSNLNVSPPSASKMAVQMTDKGLVNFQKYGFITLTEKGRALGTGLIRRHEVINEFLCLLKGTVSELRETEKIEHYLSPETVAGMERFISERKSVTKREKSI